MLDIGKRGQEGVTLTTLLLIVLGVVVVVVIILGATGIFGDIFDRGGTIIPERLEAATQACRISAQGNLVTDFCYTFKEVGDDLYVNCEDPRIRDALAQQDISVSISCNGGDPPGQLLRDAEQALCDGLSESDVARATLNGEEGFCSDYVDFAGLPDSDTEGPPSS